MVIKRKKRTALGKFSAWCYKMLNKSFIGKFFTSYEKANDKFEKITKKEVNKTHTPRKNRLAKALENNVFARIIPCIYHAFLRIKVSNYATVVVGMGAVSLTMYILNYLGVWSLGNFKATETMFVLPAILIILPIPYLFSRKSLAQSFLTNRPLNFIVFKFFGADYEAVRDSAVKNRVSSTMLAFLIGAGLGALSYFIQKPEYVLFGISILIFAYAIIKTPEIGIILTIFTMPFVHMLIIKWIILYVALAYSLKLILHKRVISFEYFDIWPTLAIIGMIFCGIDYQNPKNSLPTIGSNLIILISYFLIANLIRSKDWFKRCIFALTSSAFICAIVGIAQVLLGVLSAYLSLNLPLFGDCSGYLNGANSLFTSSTAFAYYMVIAIPFALIHIFAERREAKKVGGFFIAMILTLGLVVARSNPAIIGIFFGVLLLLLIRHRNYMYLALFAIVTPIVLYFTLRNNEPVLNFLNTFDAFRAMDPAGKLEELKAGFNLWRESPWGLGIGASGEHNSLLIQLLLDYGIVMAVLFAMCIIMFARLVFSYCAKEKGKHRKIYCSAGLCALFGIFVTGIFENVWKDQKIMLLSIVCMALSFAYIKIERELNAQKIVRNDFSQASVDIELEDDEYHEYVLGRKYVRAPRKLKSKINNKIHHLKIKTKKKTTDNDDEDDDDRV